MRTRRRKRRLTRKRTKRLMKRRWTRMMREKVRFGQTLLQSIGKPAKEVGVMIHWIAALVPMRLYEAPTYSTKQI